MFTSKDIKKVCFDLSHVRVEEEVISLITSNLIIKDGFAQCELLFETFL